MSQLATRASRLASGLFNFVVTECVWVEDSTEVFTSSNISPSVEIVTGVGSSETFVTLVIHTLIFIPNSFARQCSRSTSSCNFTCELMVRTLSPAYFRFVTRALPILKPPSKSSSTKRRSASANMLKRYGDRLNPCLSPRKTANHSLRGFPSRMLDFWLSYNERINSIRCCAYPPKKIFFDPPHFLTSGVDKNLDLH